MSAPRVRWGRLLIAAGLVVVIAAGCQKSGERRRGSVKDAAAPSGGGATVPAPAPTNAAPSERVETPVEAPQTPAPLPPPVRPEFPTGTVVRPGFVTSPYAPLNGPIDVRDPATGQQLASGTLVRCPFTNKPFRVP